ncbi:transforming protein Ski, putative [Pediculus humanus corporis]|uniref:Transforming protein Ski, putative n=1 Tax=Pediculus humanus subsp. corporis TaxID=121224 RepID=E0VZC1_PEDHC|nr:transforming protein Ski, putative [Pediculus humanus corporis]EEB18727.1 transforming protein Ski, putative [Pediculus humanus corporis]
METLVQPYTPHLKKVLKKYQLSAVKSLQGPSTLLGPCLEVATPVPSKTEDAPSTARESPTTVSRTVRSPAADIDNFIPPPFPVQQLPILTEADQRSERGETELEGESISCFVVGGEKRLCLPQVLNSVLQNFTLAQINQVCDDLQIFCSRCNPEQLEVLKVTGILPASAPSCGLITKTDAERLCSALLQHGVPATSLPSPGAVSFQVYHECFGKCRGLCTPSLYSTPNSRCIECFECHAMFSPQHFVCHAHRPLQNRTCHWGFDSSNWRSYLLVARGQPDYDVAVKKAFRVVVQLRKLGKTIIDDKLLFD